jgi:hypothetical protein
VNQHDDSKAAPVTLRADQHDLCIWVVLPAPYAGAAAQTYRMASRGNPGPAGIHWENVPPGDRALVRTLLKNALAEIDAREANEGSDQ